MHEYSITDHSEALLDQPKLYVNQYGDVYPMPESRAELVRHLHFQRRLSRHLVDVIMAISRLREVSR